MDYYQINDLERLSGIKAHTIRIWEKRYGIITPHRTETNIRFYDDEQLKKLLNVAALSSAGYKISKIAAMEAKELVACIQNTQYSEEVEVQYGYYINNLISGMLDFDETSFSDTFEKICTKYGVQSALVNILYPFLHKTGVLWTTDQTMPVQEHFASMIIKRKLFSLINNLPQPTKAKRFLLYLPADEFHEVGLLFAEYIIRYNGHHTINLGQNVPFRDIAYVIEKTNPNYLLSFLVSDDHSKFMNQLHELISRQFKQVQCLIAGGQNRIELYAKLSNIIPLKNPGEILKFL